MSLAAVQWQTHTSTWLYVCGAVFMAVMLTILIVGTAKAKIPPRKGRKK